MSEQDSQRLPDFVKDESSSKTMSIKGADYAGATGNFAAALIEEPGQTSRFAAVSFRSLF